MPGLSPVVGRPEESIVKKLRHWYLMLPALVIAPNLRLSIAFSTIVLEVFYPAVESLFLDALLSTARRHAKPLCNEDLRD